LGYMFSIEDFIIAVFCCLDDLLSEITRTYASTAYMVLAQKAIDNN
jgi:hypothetical protein